MLGGCVSSACFVLMLRSSVHVQISHNASLQIADAVAILRVCCDQDVFYCDLRTLLVT